MKFKKDGFVDFLFGDWLYVRKIKRDFDQDELDARCSAAFYLMTDYSVGFDNRFHQKVNDVLCGPIGERNGLVPDSIDTIQLIGKQTITLFVGLIHIHALEFSNGKVDNAEKTTRKINQSLGELVAAIYQTIKYYNQRRIHSAHGVPPVVFAQQQETKYY